MKSTDELFELSKTAVYWTYSESRLTDGVCEFIVKTRQPLFPHDEKASCEYCRSGCEFVLFQQHESKCITLRCPSCDYAVRGGKFHVGLYKTPPKSRERIFSDDDRWAILKRDLARCRWCGSSGDNAELHIDHIIPASLGGPSVVLNGVVLCSECNIAKRASMFTPFVMSSLCHTHRSFLHETLEREPRVYEVLKAIGCSLTEWKPEGMKVAEWV